MNNDEFDYGHNVKQLYNDYCAECEAVLNDPNICKRCDVFKELTQKSSH